MRDRCAAWKSDHDFQRSPCLSARVCIRKQLGDNLLSFAMPFALFREMEADVEGSFLQRHTWQELLAAKRMGRTA